MRVRLVIPLEIPSWNEVMNMHFQVRNKTKNLWHEQVALAINSQLSKEEKDHFKSYLGEDDARYNVSFLARRKKLLDASNLCVKFCEDGLKGRLITDDSPKYVANFSVSQELVRKGELPETIVHVEILSERISELYK